MGNEMHSNEWREKASDFFQGYCRMRRKFIADDGCLSLEGMQFAAHFLLQSEVFDSADEMRKEALSDYGITLPDDVFALIER